MTAGDRALLRRLELFRPYPDAVPWALIEAAQLEEAKLERLEAQVAAAVREVPSVHLRVAKLDEEPVGVYLLEQSGDYAFQLLYLQVDGHWQRRGIGRWLLGHALGLAESKGGRSLGAERCPPLTRFLESFGFIAEGDGGLRYPFTPE